jgi:hypothetical protein
VRLGKIETVWAVLRPFFFMYFISKGGVISIRWLSDLFQGLIGMVDADREVWGQHDDFSKCFTMNLFQCLIGMIGAEINSA